MELSMFDITLLLLGIGSIFIGIGAYNGKRILDKEKKN